MTNSIKQLLLVVGMHRSGTSAFTRSARVFGANFSGRLVESAEDNPKGFWEDTDLLALHYEMFDALGMAWDRLTPVTREEVLRLESLGYRTKARNLLETKMAAGNLQAFKHPRMAKLFPFWSGVFQDVDCQVLCLLPIRHPLSVARSLASRDGLKKTYSCLMWLAHVIPSLFVPDPTRAIVADYDRLLDNPARELRRIAARFGFSVDAAELEGYQSHFLAADLRHSTHSLQELEQDSDLPGLVAEVYRGLLDLASDKIRLDDPATMEMFRRWAGQFDCYYPFLKLIETTTAERDRQAILLNSAISDLGWRDASLSWRLTKPLRNLATLAGKLRGR